MALHPELETERLRLRQWRESDVDPFHDFYRDPQSEASTARRFRAAMSGGAWRSSSATGTCAASGFGPSRTGPAAFAGYSGLWFPEGWADPEIGWGFAPQFRGQGYAGEAARTRPRFWLPRRKLRAARQLHGSDQRGLDAVAEKLGATRDGEFVLDGKPHIVYRHTEH